VQQAGSEGVSNRKLIFLLVVLFALAGVIIADEIIAFVYCTLSWLLALPSWDVPVVEVT